jgi:hypothetical protein
MQKSECRCVVVVAVAAAAAVVVAVAVAVVFWVQVRSCEPVIQWDMSCIISCTGH